MRMSRLRLVLVAPKAFEERIRASHHIFRREGLEEKLNLQREGNKAKVNQVRQVRTVILRYNLEGEE